MPTEGDFGTPRSSSCSRKYRIPTARWRLCSSWMRTMNFLQNHFREIFGGRIIWKGFETVGVRSCSTRKFSSRLVQSSLPKNKGASIAPCFTPSRVTTLARMIPRRPRASSRSIVSFHSTQNACSIRSNMWRCCGVIVFSINFQRQGAFEENVPFAVGDKTYKAIVEAWGLKDEQWEQATIIDVHQSDEDGSVYTYDIVYKCDNMVNEI